MSSKITVGKIVANATESGWSQAYHAGGFTAVLSVTETEGKEKTTLQETGKKLLDTLVSEYFTLTTKDLDTIKSAVEATVSKAPEHANVSLVVASVVKNILYIVIANQGRALLKRQDKLGLLLEVKPEDDEKIASLSGFLESNDIVLIHTPSFANVFPHDELSSAFEGKTAEELSEFFAPKVHEAQDGSVAALVFSFHEEPQYAQEMPKEVEKPKEEETRDHPLPGFEAPEEEKTDLVPTKKSFSHRQKLFLTIAVVLGLVLIGSVVVFQMKQQDAKQQALFQSAYTPAKAKYDDATGLLNLNKALAISDLQDAQSTLQTAKGKFDPNSTYAKQIASLLDKVNSTLDDAKKVPLISAQQAAANASPLLSFAAKHDGAYITQDSTNFYTADNTGITQYAKKATGGKQIVKNTSAYNTIGGFDTYLGNFYVLDQKDGIVKYVSTGGTDYSKSSYLAGSTKPDFSKAISIAIDSDIWVITSDGTVMKFTKGNQDSLSVTGLDKPLSSPTQIYTNVDFNNVYILDKGNERVVVLKKDGSFVAQYASDTVRTTSFMDISEKDKKIYLLSSGTVYQIDLK